MRYFTDKGLLELTSTGTYKVPNRKYEYSSDDLEIYCEEGYSYYECDGASYELDPDMLAEHTISHFVESLIDGVKGDFQYVDINGQKIPHPERGLEAPILEAEPEPEIELDLEKEEVPDESGLYKDFLHVLDEFEVKDTSTTREWVSKLEELYDKSVVQATKDDMDFAIEERKNTYNNYYDHMNTTTRKNLQVYKAQSKNASRQMLTEKGIELEKRWEEIEKMTITNANDLQMKLSKTDEWLTEYEKYEKEQDEDEKFQDSQLDMCLSAESKQIYKAIGLKGWHNPEWQIEDLE